MKKRAKKPTGRPPGRPPVLPPEITPKMMADARRVGRVGGTKQDLADLWGCSLRTLERWAPKLDPVMKAKYAETRLAVREKQLKTALAGQPVGQIWWGKQHLGQTDRQQVTGANGGPLELVVSSVDRLAELLNAGNPPAADKEPKGE
jgi:hypothetical protein